MVEDWLCCDAALVEDVYSAQKEVAKLRAELALAKSAALADSAATTASGARVVVSRLDGIESKALQAHSSSCSFTHNCSAQLWCLITCRW